MTTSDGKRDFFVSFTTADRSWATWIAWVLEEARYSVWFQDWDFKGNFILEMDKAHKLSRRTVAVLSPDYLKSRFAAPEWAARFAQDATSEHDLLIPVRVRPCELEGLLAQIVYVDLVGCGEAAARDKILGRVKGDRLKPNEPPLFPGEVSHDAVPERPAYPAAPTGGAAATKHVSPHAHRPEPDLKRQGPIDAIRERMFELMERHGIDLPTMAEIIGVPISMLGRAEFLDCLDNPTLDRLANLFCVTRDWLVGQTPCPMQYGKRWYKETVDFVRHILELEKGSLQPLVYFLKPDPMNADNTMDAEGARYRVGISIALTHKTSSGKTFRTFEPWAWEPWNYQKSRIDFLSIFMLLDRTWRHQLEEDMKGVGMTDEESWEQFNRFDRIKYRAIGVDENTIGKYNNCKIFLKELIESGAARGSAWCPDVFTDRLMVGSRIRPEIEFVEERYFEILKALAHDVRWSRLKHEDRS